MRNLGQTPPVDASPLTPFLTTVLRSGLMDRDELLAAVNAAPADQRGQPASFARHLVRAGKLSGFQAKKLLQGAYRGLMLGPFQVLAPIGKGGMGTVYLGRDSRSRQLVALKVLPPKRAQAEDRLLARFRREMEMSQRVAHSHIAWTYEVGVFKGVYYIAMEYIPGRSLYRAVVREGTLAVPRAARLFAEVALGLEHAHDQGLIHRDLKPSNILITPNDHAKVLDLGLALIQGETSGDREVVGGLGYAVGTMDYIAPEQAADSSQADARSDIYGLGCTLYFALAGRPPFPGGNAMEKIKRHKTEKPTPLPELNPTLPPGFVHMVNRMMAKRPEDRFSSAADLREHLLGWVSGEPPPPDETGEAIFRRAMATLESEDADADAGDDMLPTPDTEEEATEQALVLFPPSPLGPAQRRKPFWVRNAVPLGLAAAFVFGWGFVILLWLLFWRH